MGIKFLCPNGHKLHVKSFLASQRGVCPQCGEKFLVPAQSLPDIRVESLGAKESKRVATAAGRAERTSSKSPGLALPNEESDQLVESSDAARMPAVQEAVAASRQSHSGRAAEVAAVPPSPAIGEDPIAQAPAAMWYVRIASGEQFGPAQGDLMQRWLTEGRVAADSLVWREGWAEWMVAGKVFRQLSLDVVPPSVVPGSIDAFERGLAEHVETLVLPSQSAGNVAPSGDVAIDPVAKPSAIIGARRQAKSHHRLALTILLVAILCLLPLLVYVLWQQ